jgi:hypothetical protein
MLFMSNILSEIAKIQDQIQVLNQMMDDLTFKVLQSSKPAAKPQVMPEHDLDIALTMYADHLKADYERISPKKMYPEAKFDVTFERGRKFMKVVKSSWGSTSVHSFICIVPHDQWKFGDILKAASWAQPAKNFARGNVLNPSSYSNHSWTGA